MQDTTNLIEKKRIPALDGLRGMAIIFIILYHLMPHLIPGGFLGVDIFLILSGYLMTDGMMRYLMTRSKMPLKDYLKKRLVRMARPMLWMCFIVLIYITLFQRDVLINLRDSLLTSITFTNNWWQIFGGYSYFDQYLAQSPFVHLWYLSLNMQLSLVWPFIFVFLAYILKNHKTIAATILVLAGLSFAWMFILYIPNVDPSRIYYGTDTRAFSLLMGSALAVEWPTSKFQDILAVPQKRWMNWIGLFAIMGIVIAVMLLTDQSVFTYRVGMITFDLMVIALLRFGLHSQLLSSILFRLKPLTWIGKRSFSYYLWYFPVLILYHKQLQTLNSFSTIHFIVQILLIMVLGEISYRFFETDKLPIGIFNRVRREQIWQDIQLMKEQPKTSWKLITIYTMLCMVMLIAIIGFFQTTNTPSASSQALEDVITANEKYAQTTKDPSNDSNQVINNVEGLTREETVFSNTTDITFIGDSLLLAIADKLTPMYPNAIIDGATGRQLYQSKSTIEELNAAGQIKNTVVVMLGANGNFTYAQLEEVIKAIGLEKQIFFVNVHLPRTWENSVNTTLQTVTETYSNVHIIDWKTHSQHHPEWFYEDRVHPNSTGANELALLITREVYAVIRGN